MGLIAQANKSYGEAVARTKRASELLAEAEKKGEGAFKSYVRILPVIGGGGEWVGLLLSVTIYRTSRPL